MPRKAQNIPANEPADKRFVRVATSRVNYMLTSLKQLGTLGNTKLYTSTADQRKQIGEALKNALERALESMNKGGETQQEFKLK